jgi:hypothetical protein
MPGFNADGRVSVVACDPDLRALLGDEHAYHHRHAHADGESCPFGMSGAPALASAAMPATLTPDAGSLLLLTDVAAIAGVRLSSAHRARAPPSV